MFGSTFYHGLIRKHVILFGTLFNDIYLENTDADNNITSITKVPLTFAAKDKMLARVFGDPTLNRPTSITLPRMSFLMTKMNYRSGDKLNPMHRIVVKSIDPNKNKFTYTPVPYDFDFDLYIFVKNTEDGTKIIENILPYFTPDFTLDVKLVEEMNYEQKIPVVHNGSPSIEDNFAAGSLVDARAIVWTLRFTVKGYLLGAVKEKPIIKFAKVNLGFDGSNTVFDTVTVSPGLTIDGRPTSNASTTINPNLIFADDDFGFIESLE